MFPIVGLPEFMGYESFLPWSLAKYETPGNYYEKKKIKTESTRKLSKFNFQWTKILYQNNLNHIAFFFTFFKC